MQNMLVALFSFEDQVLIILYLQEQQHLYRSFCTFELVFYSLPFVFLSKYYVKSKGFEFVEPTINLSGHQLFSGLLDRVILVTSYLGVFVKFGDVGDKTIKSVIDVSNASSTYFVSNIDMTERYEPLHWRNSQNKRRQRLIKSKSC